MSSLTFPGIYPDVLFTAIFCYDPINEPVVPGAKCKDDDWQGPAFAGEHFVEFVTLNQQDRTRPDFARQWVKHLTATMDT